MKRPIIEFESTPGSPVVDGASRTWTFEPMGTVIVDKPNAMYEFSVQMHNGVEISGRYPNKAALRDALEMIMNELEHMP